MHFNALSRAAFLLASSLLLNACGHTISIENYNKLQIGQSYDEVRQLIGEPARCDEVLGVRSCVWGDEQHGISVSFVAGKV
ncbi:hypothetical protein, partial [Candidatus Propionivibrio aalborgensis]|uniref:hypothetical protein n=1 Tax=Candidatus Propionivibrio aalborgensis TaxID=1860101 RepID=UPI00164517B0